jgi:F0F1-type ATP synthase assembly protein I
MNTQTTDKNYIQQMRQYGHILMLSAWGFVIVFASLLFLYVGHLLDEWLGTAPNFMLGLFFLAIVTTIIRLYQEAWLKRKDV